MGDRDRDYDFTKRTRAVNIATLRAVVAGYLLYLGYTLIRDLLRGTSTLSPALAWSIGLLFIAAGLGFGWYTWRRWRIELEAARIPIPPAGASDDGEEPAGPEQ